MTQLALAVAQAAIIKSAKDKCWYCEEKKSNTKHKSKLERGDVRGLLNKVEKVSGLSWMGGQYGEMKAEAHHLISVRPMADASQLHKYIESEHGKIEDDIGYDLNHPKNSVWMPGRPVPTDDADKIAVIKESGAQIHNSGHPDYRSNVSTYLMSSSTRLRKTMKTRSARYVIRRWIVSRKHRTDWLGG